MEEFAQHHPERLSGTERLQIRAWALKAERRGIEACPGPHYCCDPGQQILSSHQTTWGIERIYLMCLALRLAWTEGTSHAGYCSSSSPHYCH